MGNGQLPLSVCTYEHIKSQLIGFLSLVKYLYRLIDFNDNHACYIKPDMIVIITDRIHCIEQTSLSDRSILYIKAI